MKNKTLFFITSIIAIIFACNYGCFNKRPSHTSDTVKVEVRDTVRDTVIITDTAVQEIVRDRTIVRTDTVRRDTVLNVESRHYCDTFQTDAAKAKVDVYATGIDIEVDSIRAEITAEKEIVTKTIEITNTVVKKKHFYWGPSVGIGYGFINKKPDIYIGISAGYQF